LATPEEARRKASATYDAAADAYDHPANTFWERFGRRTVERLALAPGARVLDVCCGSGASAIPAARAVGPCGAVLGVDLAANLLELARGKSRAADLTQLELRRADMLALGALEPFDAVVCVFGIFFVPDMPAAVRELWRHVKPGGRLALTTWGPRLFEPLNSAFWRAVGEQRPELVRAFNPWDRISEPAALRTLLAEGGIESAGRAEVVAEAGVHPLGSPEDGWALVQGSGYRGTLEQLAPAEREHVRAACEAFLRAERVRSVEASVVYAVAQKA
jgi:ubiquinone/menaquinone biosynthesis C-methylase UbiE